MRATKPLHTERSFRILNPTQTEKENRIETADKPAERFAHTNQEKKRSENRRRASQYMKDLNRRNAIGDMLYMVGFWVEYVGVCVRRKVSTVVRGIADTVLNLLLIVLRPILIGLITLIEDLAGPFVRIASGIRHIHELPAQLEDSGAGEVRAAKARYLASGIRKYSVLLWNAITYILPAVAAAALVVVVRGGLGLHFVLNVQVDGEHVGAVESEQVFENAREDVQSRINMQNMPARTKIIAAYPSLSPAERQAADFILSDPDAVPHLSIKQIAARAGVSMPTVTRLVRRAGYSGFTELRIALAGSFTKNKPVASGDDDGEFFSKLMLGQMRSVEAALKAADEERICALAKRLVTSTGCVLLCGAGAAAGIAESAGSALVELGIRAVCPQKPETQAAYSALLGEGDTLFCIRSEGSRESAQQLTECIRTAKKGGAYTVFVCNEPCISAESEADCSICTTCESDIRGLLGYATSASLVAFTEALLALTARYAGRIPENAYRGRMQ